MESMIKQQFNHFLPPTYICRYAVHTVHEKIMHCYHDTASIDNNSILVPPILVLSGVQIVTSMSE